MLAVVLHTGRAILAIWLQARRVLGANTNTVANLDAFSYILADADGFSNDFVSDDERIESAERALTTRQR